MSQVSLATLLEHLHEGAEEELTRARKALAHPTDKGDASETVWIELLSKHLPKRYAVCKAHVVDSQGNFSDQIDVVVHDRQYSPLVFSFKDAVFIPAESVYAVFEAKQEATAETIRYAQRKAASVRRLKRTSVPVPTVNGMQDPKDHGHIICGLLTLSCSWKPPLGQTLLDCLQTDQVEGTIDIGCVADAGVFFRRPDGSYDLQTIQRSTTRFFFELLARLQELGTVPMLDVRAYAAHIP